MAESEETSGTAGAEGTAGTEGTEGVETTLPRDARKCKIKGCKRGYRAKGYCSVHYRKWRHGEFPKARYKICTKEGCRKPRARGSLCAEHASTASSAS
ncbi:MAG: vegetative protein [Pseudomonadota bacterium]